MNHIYQAITFPGNFEVEEVAGKAGQTACKAGHSKARLFLPKPFLRQKLFATSKSYLQEKYCQVQQPPF